ncbi:solute carrier family 35 member B1 [Lepisosteus oculatus]|uniref:solute carrier family 35 member B1 n=1 Tax=Lepisosteus oculatus TaxID=7918 RepID=UPI00371C1DDE
MLSPAPTAGVRRVEGSPPGIDATGDHGDRTSGRGSSAAGRSSSDSGTGERRLSGNREAPPGDEEGKEPVWPLETEHPLWRRGETEGRLERIPAPRPLASGQIASGASPGPGPASPPPPRSTGGPGWGAGIRPPRPGGNSATIPGQIAAGRVERDAGLKGAGRGDVGSGAVAVSIPVLGDSMAAGRVSLLQNERVRLIVCFLGVFFCYLYYGILQETITRGEYGTGEKKEKFKYATTLVFIQCIMNAVFARILIQIFEKSKPDRTRSWLYGVCSLSYLGAMVSSNSALQYVNYPTQVLGKSCKPIPVMVLGVTILRKKYPLAKYLFVLLIVTGVALFMYKPKKGVAEMDEHLFGFGEMLLLLSLTLDGLTGVSQDHMRAHFQTGSNHMMLNVNLWSTLVLGIGVLWTGEFWEFLSFADRYPGIVPNILLFGLTSAMGQSFIFMTVVYFGPLTCSIITTTRKFFTILGSVLIFGNSISTMQWVGTVLVFLGLGLDAKFGKGPKKTPR